MTFLEIDLKKLEFNYFSLKERLSPNSNMIGVIKANAYGSVAPSIAEKLVGLGIKALAVAYAEEAVQLRQIGIKVPILVFYPQLENFKHIIHHNLEPVLYSKRSWEKFAERVKEEKKAAYPIHIKYNTGLNRIGFHPNETNWVVEKISNAPFEVKSIYSHLGQTESLRPDAETERQIGLFKEVMQRHKEANHPRPEFHLLNTSGVFNYPEYHLDWVRVGIGLYGFANHPQWNVTLQPVAQLKTNITQIHEIKAGETVGYNCGWKATQNTRIGVLPIGHADGFSRQYGHGKGWVLIDSSKAPVVGNVCMDMIMVELGNIPCDEGSEVVVIGSGVRADELAENAGTISYELLSALGNRIPRIIKT